MEPRLLPDPYRFLASPRGDAQADWLDEPFAIIREDEGVTAIVAVRSPKDQAEIFARITLQVHSDLEGVGLTAAVSTVLAEAGIACNIVAGFHHDHLFVPWHRREEALAILKAVSDNARL